MWESEEGRKTLVFILLASIGGLLGHLMRVVESGGKVRWRIACLEMLSSGFVGYLALMVCKAVGLSYEWTGVTVGVLGWVGASASVLLLERLVKRRFGINELSDD